jgi:hypothetical protein
VRAGAQLRRTSKDQCRTKSQRNAEGGCRLATSPLSADQPLFDGHAHCSHRWLRRPHRHDAVREAILQAFDLLELNGEDLRPLPLSRRKVRMARLLARVPPGIELNAHTDDDGMITGSQWPRAIARFVLGEQTRMAAMARVLALRIRLPPQSRLPSSDSADTPTYRNTSKFVNPFVDTFHEGIEGRSTLYREPSRWMSPNGQIVTRLH